MELLAKQFARTKANTRRVALEALLDLLEFALQSDKPALLAKALALPRGALLEAKRDAFVFGPLQ